MQVIYNGLIWTLSDSNQSSPHCLPTEDLLGGGQMCPACRRLWTVREWIRLRSPHVELPSPDCPDNSGGPYRTRTGHLHIVFLRKIPRRRTNVPFLSLWTVREWIRLRSPHVELPSPDCPDNSGGPYRTRTGHLHIANVALYQMS